MHETILEKAAENTGVLEHGEIIPNVPITSVNNAATQNVQQTYAQTNIQTNEQAASHSNIKRTVQSARQA